MSHLKRVPVAGDVFHWHGFNLEVVDMDHARIDKIAVTLLPEEQK